jgi:uncharacterized membrane protein YccF (DUF307 family)
LKRAEKYGFMADKKSSSPNILIRALWFIFIGWEATAVWLFVAWMLNASIIFLPFGLKMINWTPKVLTLKDVQKTIDNDSVDISNARVNILVRAVYFLLVGWWISLVWMGIGYLLCLSIIGLPFGIWMLNRLPEVTTLYR